MRHIAFAAALLAPLPATAAIVVVDPDAASVGSNISSFFPGVTLSASPNGYGTGTDVFAVDPTAYSEPFTASTGRLVFGTNGSAFPHLFQAPAFSALRVDFAMPVLSVSIDAIGNDPADTGLLQAFNSSNMLLGTFTTASLGISQVGTMTFASGTGDIAYVIASGLDFASSLGLDNLVYETADTPVPAPATVGLFGLALAGLGLARRR